MNKLKLKNISEKEERLLIDFAYGHSSFFNALKAKRIISKSEVARKTYFENKNIARKVRLIENKNLPTEASIRIMQKIDALQSLEKKSLNSTGTTMPPLNWSMAGGLATIIITLITTLILNLNISQPRFSQMQIREANRQVLQSFRILAKVFKKTELIVKGEILNNGVSFPVSESKKFVNYLFEVKK